jgi:hypothetical protein
VLLPAQAEDLALGGVEHGWLPPRPTRCVSGIDL